jgi:hypothetical protein
VPWLHTEGSAHFPVHEPQCSGSVRASTQAPSQLERPAAQAHEPAAHWNPAEHVRPHPPQLVGSIARSTQPPPQALAGAAHPPG